MKELIKISDINGKRAVDARELHNFLGSKRDFSSWIKDRIEKYQFVENQDFQIFTKFGEKSKPERGRPSIDYALSIDMAKELSMIENNEMGRMARRYFIECEKIAQGNTIQQRIPTTFSEALELAAKQQKEIEQLESNNKHLTRNLDAVREARENERKRANYHYWVSQNRLKEAIDSTTNYKIAKKELMDAQPAIDFAASVMDNGENCLVGTLAKMIAQCGIEIGRTRLFEWLRENNYMGKIGCNKNILHQQYVENGIFVVKEVDRETKSGEHLISVTPMVTPKGQQYFINKFRRLKAEGKI